MDVNLNALLLALHLLAAAAWFGAGWYDKLLMGPLRRGGEGIPVVKKYVERGGGGVWFGPASILTVLSGAILYWRLGIDWRTTSGAMVSIGAGVATVALLLGIFVHAPTEKKLKQAIRCGDEEAAVDLTTRMEHHSSLSGYMVTAAFLLMALRHAF